MQRCILCGRNYPAGLQVMGCLICFPCERALLRGPSAEWDASRRARLLALYGEDGTGGADGVREATAACGETTAWGATAARDATAARALAASRALAAARRKPARGACVADGAGGQPAASAPV